MELSTNKLSKPVAYLVVILMFGFLPILGAVLSNLGSNFAFVPFGFVYGMYPLIILFTVFREKNEFNERTYFQKAISLLVLLHIFYLYYRQIDWILDYFDNLFHFIGAMIFFIAMAPFISSMQMGSYLAELVKFL